MALHNEAVITRVRCCNVLCIDHRGLLSQVAEEQRSNRSHQSFVTARGGEESRPISYLKDPLDLLSNVLLRSHSLFLLKAYYYIAIGRTEGSSD